jgi:N-acetyl-anhydromuramyl-L-alanine amidase AmpD
MPLTFPLPFIEAAHFTPANRMSLDWIVLHSMESSEKPGTARNVAFWFAGPKAPMASAHYLLDNVEVIQSVRDKDIAWHAPGANARGIGIEHAGRASQTFAEWQDAFSMAMLRRSIELCAVLCRTWGIPARSVDAAGLLAGERGLTTHAEVSRAWKKSSHWDPGPAFPLAWYVRSVAAILAQAAVA